MPSLSWDKVGLQHLFHSQYYNIHRPYCKKVQIIGCLGPNYIIFTLTNNSYKAFDAKSESLYLNISPNYQFIQ